jgi:hypothetical protein
MKIRFSSHAFFALIREKAGETVVKQLRRTGVPAKIRQLRESGRKRILLWSAVFVLPIILFFPFKFSMLLPGEVRYSSEDRLISRENAYVVISPGEKLRLYRRGETVFLLDDPFLRFARERIAYMLNFDRLLFEQQRALRETIGDSLITQRKIRSDLHAGEELDRKMAEGRKVAGRDVIFIPSIGNISPGYFVRSGVELGKMCSGERIIRAYADDQQIRTLKPGMPVELMVRDRVEKFNGKISKVHPIPFFLKDSPALQIFGGDIPVDAAAGDTEKIQSLHTVYAVDIVPQKTVGYQTGRYVRAQVQYRIIPGVKILQFIVSALRREFF